MCDMDSAVQYSWTGYHSDFPEHDPSTPNYDTVKIDTENIPAARTAGPGSLDPRDTGP